MDDPYIGMANNTQFAQNILTFLTANCVSSGCQGNCNQGICFKDYCFCNPGYTGDACDQGSIDLPALVSTKVTHHFNFIQALSPCQFEGGCIDPQNCTARNSIRYSSAILFFFFFFFLRGYFFIKKRNTHNITRQYRCPSGACTFSPEACPPTIFCLGANSCVNGQCPPPGYV